MVHTFYVYDYLFELILCLGQYYLACTRMVLVLIVVTLLHCVQYVQYVLY